VLAGSGLVLLAFGLTTDVWVAAFGSSAVSALPAHAQAAPIAAQNNPAAMALRHGFLLDITPPCSFHLACTYRSVGQDAQSCFGAPVAQLARDTLDGSVSIALMGVLL
jgi:hypothetical protein